MKNFVIALLGYAFIGTGLVGIFLPFLQGILFIVIGVYLLSIGSPKVHKRLHLWYLAFKVRFPRISRTLEKVEKKWEDMLARWQKR